MLEYRRPTRLELIGFLAEIAEIADLDDFEPACLRLAERTENWHLRSVATQAAFDRRAGRPLSFTFLRFEDLFGPGLARSLAAAETRATSSRRLLASVAERDLALLRAELERARRRRLLAACLGAAAASLALGGLRLRRPAGRD
jgi:hypothetical protein